MLTLNVLSSAGLKRAAESGNSNSELNTDMSSADDLRNAPAEFAAILGGWLFPLFGSKGQDSEEIKAGDRGQQVFQDSLLKLTIPGVPGLELQNVLAGILGLGQMQVLQSNFPAGMEANSGLTKDQGSDSTITAALMNIQKDVSHLTELDQYKETIAKLLQELAGKMEANSGLIKDQGRDSTITAALMNIQKDVSHLTELDQYKETIAKLLQELAGKFETTSPQANQIKVLFPGNIPQIEQVLAGLSGEMKQEVKPEILTAIQAGLMAYESKPVKATQDIKSGQIIEDLSPGQQNQLSIQNTNNRFERKVQSTVLDLNGQELNVPALNSEDAPTEGYYQNAGVIGPNGQIEKNETITSGVVKVVPTPIWDQVAHSLNNLRSDVNKDVNKLEIKLHPAELGKIQVFLRWEDGLVHLQLKATEVATGNMLQSHLSDLRQSLQNSGVSCGQMEMGLGGEQQQTPHKEQQGHTYFREWPIEEEQVGSGGILYSSLLQQVENRINVTA